MSITLSEIAANSTHLSGNPIWVKATTSGIPAGATDYQILLQVQSVDGELVGSPFTPDAIAPNQNNEALFDISGIVDQEMEKDFKFPLNGGMAHGHLGLVYVVDLYPGERYINSNGDLQESWGNILGPIFIVKGKLPKGMLSVLNDAGTNWYDYFASEGRFLSLMPVEQTVSPWQPVKVWIKGNNPGSNSYPFNITIKSYFDDDSTDQYTQTLQVYRDMLHEIDLQPSNYYPVLNDGNKKLVKYEVIGNGNGVNYETRTFHVNWDYYKKYWYLFVDNQAGGIECIWLRGRMKYVPTGERTVSGRPQQRGAGVKTPTLLVSGNKRQRKWIINSGFKPGTNEMEALDIILDAPRAWLAIPPEDGSTDLNDYSLVPVIVTSNELTLHNDMDYGMENVDLEIIEAH